MSGFKDFSDGNFFTAAEVDGYLMQQTVMRFSTAALLSSQLSSYKTAGMVAYAADTGFTYQYNGTVWIPQSSDWQTYSAAFTAGGVNVTVGNATVISKWRYAGGQIEAFYKFVVGSTSNMQTGAYAWALPVAIETNEVQYSVIGHGLYFDVSATSTVAHYPGFVFPTNASNCVIVQSPNARMATTVPVAVAAGDYYSMRLRYRGVTTNELT